MAPFFTGAAQNAGFSMPEGASLITAIGDGFLWPQFVFTKLVQALGVVGIVIAAALLAVAWFMYLKNPVAWEVAAGAPAEAKK
jgi:PTS system galactitol-specific IIC component